MYFREHLEIGFTSSITLESYVRPPSAVLYNYVGLNSRESKRNILNVFETLLQVQNEIKSQEMALEFAIRKRTHHLQQAKDELEWQLKTVSNMHPAPI